MDERKPIMPFLCLAVSAIGLIVVLCTRDDIIIRYRLHAYKAIRSACIIAISISATWAFASIALFGRKKPEKKAPDVPEQEPEDKKIITEETRRRLYNDLLIYGKDKWKALKEIGTLLAQLDSMNEYQEKLDPLLEQNDYLSEKPTEIIQRLENCMYVNIRKLLNYMNVLQTRSLQPMSEKVHECVEKNAALLTKTDEFILAITDYVNGDMAPGEEGRAKEYVDNYMYLVLDAIKLPETYLK